MTFTPSPQQTAIFTAITSSAGNLIIDACAGSGKTTTLVEALKLLPQRRDGCLVSQSIYFLAFNKNIADTLSLRCPKHVSCSTFHSLGFRALKSITGPKVKVEARKVPKIVWSLLDREDPDIQNVIRLVGLLKSTWPIASSAGELCTLHDLAFEDPRSAIATALRALELSNKDLSQIDFDDMLYLPVLLNASFSSADWIFVDEAQDLNSIQHEIIFRLHKPEQNINLVNTPYQMFSSTRLVAVGDPHQAIYAFRGAAADSMDLLASRFHCSTLPLSVSYRCPKQIVAEAQKYI